MGIYYTRDGRLPARARVADAHACTAWSMDEDEATHDKLALLDFSFLSSGQEGLLAQHTLPSRAYHPGRMGPLSSRISLKMLILRFRALRTETYSFAHRGSRLTAQTAYRPP